MEFLIYDMAIFALVYLIITIRLIYEGIKKDFIVKCIDSSLLLFLLNHEEFGENAIFKRMMDESAHVFLCQGTILHSKALHMHRQF